MPIQKVKLYAPYQYDADMVSFDTGLECKDDSKTNQSMAEEADINTIVKRFGITGTVPVLDRLPLNDDFEGVNDFHTAMNVLRKAEEQFMLLPAHIRSKFQNDPGLFVDFCSLEENIDELRKMGLAKPAEQVKNPDVGSSGNGTDSTSTPTA